MNYLKREDSMEDIENSINRFIAETREFASLSDDQIRELLHRIHDEKPQLFDLLEEESKRKTLKDIKRMIKEIKNGIKNWRKIEMEAT